MRFQFGKFSRWGVWALAATVTCASVASAASINYGDVSTPKFDFLSVTESSGTDVVPIYGAPEGFDSGVDFDPQNFIASSTGGAVPDITDGQVNMGIVGKQVGSAKWGFQSVAISESGDYTLSGAGSAATAVFGGANVFLTVYEVNGAAVAPFTVDASASVSFNLAANAGSDVWNNSVLLDLGPTLGAGNYVTKAELVLNNSLVAISQAGTAASISKREFIVTIPDPVGPGEIPEPAALALSSLALCGLAAARRRG